MCSGRVHAVSENVTWGGQNSEMNCGANDDDDGDEKINYTDTSENTHRIQSDK